MVKKDISKIEHSELRQEWQKFYRDQFGMKVDFSDVNIPPKPVDGSWRLLIIAKGITNEQIFARMEKLFRCRKTSENLDNAVAINMRTTQNSYAVWVRDGIEPDVEFLGKSTCEADLDMKIGMTLTERLVLGLKFFVETGKHLDIKGMTFCSGSRDDDVPSVYWHPSDVICVCWQSVDSLNAEGGVRRVVSS